MATADTQERPGIEEHYTSSTNTSNMTVEARRRMPADDIIAAGWSRSRIGGVLMRLHSEFDGSSKPDRPTAESIQALAATYPRNRDGLVRIDGLTLKPAQAAKRERDRWFRHEQALLFSKLKSLPDARRELILWCGRAGISGGEHKAPVLLLWWLDKTCVECGGTKYELIPGTPALSNRICQHCAGTGEAHLPHGQDGRKIERFILDCLQAHRSSMVGRFRHQKTKEKT